MNYPSPLTTIFGTVVTKAQTLPPPAGYTGSTLLAYLQSVKPAIVQLNYQHGPVQELYETLAQMDKGQTTKNKTFPLIWLVEDITEARDQDSFYSNVKLRVVIAYPTSKNFKSAQREALIFQPYLTPVYRNLLKAISRTGAFNRPDEHKIPHRVTKRKYWGNDDKTASALTQFVDAIDIEDLELNVTYDYCSTN